MTNPESKAAAICKKCHVRAEWIYGLCGQCATAENEVAAAKLLGRKGGLSRSEAKVKAARENAKKGGRPKKDPNAWVDLIDGDDRPTPEDWTKWDRQDAKRRKTPLKS